MFLNLIYDHLAGNGVFAAYGNDNVGIALAGLNKGLVLQPSLLGKGDHEVVDEVILDIIMKYDHLIRQPTAATFPNREG